jgi:hypothetical protein
LPETQLRSLGARRPQNEPDQETDSKFDRKENEHALSEDSARRIERSITGNVSSEHTEILNENANA